MSKGTLRLFALCVCLQLTIQSEGNETTKFYAIHLSRVADDCTLEGAFPLHHPFVERTLERKRGSDRTEGSFGMHTLVKQY